MSDLKLFRIDQANVVELGGGHVQLEKSLQSLFERNLETLLGVRFVASEFVTNEGGRIDTLGLDENHAPVVIEYKRASNENVITQGLYYLDWLMGHRGDFQLLVQSKLGTSVSENVDWSGSRLICIAGDFGKYDAHAVKQMNRTIALIRYRRYEDDLLALEQLTATAGKSTQSSVDSPTLSTSAGTKYKTVSENLADTSSALRDLYHEVRAYLEAVGDDVQVKTNNNYIAFRRIKNYACLEIKNQNNRLLLHLRIDPGTITIEPGFTRDVRDKGHWGTGDLEVLIHSRADFEKAKPLFDLAYQNA